MNTNPNYVQVPALRKSALCADVEVRGVTITAFYETSGFGHNALSPDPDDRVYCHVVRLELGGLDVTRLLERDVDMIEEELDEQWRAR